MLTLCSAAPASLWGLGIRRVCQEMVLCDVAREGGESSQLLGLPAAFAPPAVTCPCRAGWEKVGALVPECAARNLGESCLR